MVRLLGHANGLAEQYWYCAKLQPTVVTTYLLTKYLGIAIK